jgi:hypothetical protein
MMLVITTGMQRLNISLNEQQKGQGWSFIHTPCFSFSSLDDSTVSRLMKWSMSVCIVDTNLKIVETSYAQGCSFVMVVSRGRLGIAYLWVLVFKGISYPVPFSVGSRDNSVAIVMGYWLDSWDSIPSRGKRFFSTPQHRDQIWGPPRLLSGGYWVLFPRG